MSTQTALAPAGATATRRTHHVTFPRVLHSEWIKFWSLRSTVWTVAATVVVMGAVSWLAVFFTAREATNRSTKPEDVAVLTALLHDPSVVLTGTELAKLVVAVLGVLIITGEYSTGMVRSTLTAVPRRLPAFWAKALVLTGVTAGTTVVAEVLAWAVALPTLRSHGAPLDLGAAETQRILLGGVLYLAGIALLAFAVGAIIRVAAGALATVLGLLLVVEVLFRTLPVDFFRHISPFLPATAGHQLLATQASIEQARATSSGPVLDPWAGFAVMAVWVAVVLAVAAVQLRRRDA
ncbi:MAG: ABC transporter permease subunit [Actinomycetes bacterium]